jgi:parvulin-like peptidyl-prolyl isomerase
MTKKHFYIFLIFFYNISFSQTNSRKLKSDLKLVTDIKSAKDFIKKNSEIKSKIYTYNEEKHHNNISKTLFSKSIGDHYQVEEQSANSLYKIISITSKTHYRASYIFLDGKKLKTATIDSLQSVINTKLNSGEKFQKLAGKYSMSRNSIRGGDLGWFTEDKMPKDFVEALRINELNSVYNFRLKNTDKYYIVKKTEHEKDVRLLQVLKISFEKEKNRQLINVSK